MPLPRLALNDKLHERLAEDRSPAELHRAVHLVAELVEAGVLPPGKWRAGYVFSGWLDQLVVDAVERKAKATRAAEQHVARRRDLPPRGETASRDAMARAMAESTALASLGTRVVSTAAPAEDTRRPKTRSSASTDTIALTDVRIRVGAVAELLDRSVDEVLEALGRGSLSALEPVDATRVDAVFVALRDGASAADVAARWSSTDNDLPPDCSEARASRADLETRASAPTDATAESRRRLAADPSSAPALVANLVQSKSLAPMHAQRSPRPRLDADDSAAAKRHALTSTRIEVQAVADAAGRDVEDVLRALGRRSLSAVKLVDARRTNAVLVALRNGEAPDDIAARWSTDVDDVAPPSPRAGAPPGPASADSAPDGARARGEAP